MWADNEADVDLLGFEFLVDEMVVALTEPRLLPLTLGLLGDWGAGKSSLLKLTQQELEDEEDVYVVVPFSPWQCESYDDVKAALMSAVLDRLASEAAQTDETRQAQVRRLRRFTDRVLRSGRSAFSRVWPAAAVAGVGLVDPGMAEVAGQFLQSAGSMPGPMGEEQQEVEDEDARASVTVASFRSEFSSLLKGLEHVAAVVVLIDDLDRCLPHTVVDTFEAIRLFLNVPKTAFVVAAHQKIVESAIDLRYPGMTEDAGSGLGAQYLEKMLQITVAIPSLAAPEAETYLQLLLAELHLSSENFTRVREHVERERAHGKLAVHFNLGVALDVLGTDIPDGLYADLAWAADVAPVLSRGSRGNPRQVKRFLNTLELRRRSAARRDITMEASVLAKLMVLETGYFPGFETLFRWQVAVDGPIPELAAAEAYTQSLASPPEQTPDPDEPADENRPSGRRSRPSHTADRQDPAPSVIPDSEVKEWADNPTVRAWLELSPPLGQTDLRPYFTYARDKLTPAVIPARLPAHLQQFLTRMQAENRAIRRQAVIQVVSLPADERLELLEHLIDALVRDPSGHAVASALEMASKSDDVVAPVCAALARIPASRVPRSMVSSARVQLPSAREEVRALFEAWQNSGDENLARLAREVLQMGQQGA
ncbi:KAP family P-loop NTPase fold protein [Actinomadura coerulea]|uniref:KAP family P-loop NTPase fold protein n=1 Tax=Actinomadura coerulea TaxID=46159 RepID=UPI00342DC49D